MCMTSNQRQGDNEAFLENARKESFFLFPIKIKHLVIPKAQTTDSKRKKLINMTSQKFKNFVH